VLEFNFLNDNDYYEFYKDRQSKLIKLIESAFGKPVQLVEAEDSDRYEELDEDEDE
jgi:hypothetical protein